LFEGSAPLPVDLEDLFRLPVLAGFRLTSLSTAQDETDSSPVGVFLRGLAGVDFPMDVLAIDDTCRHVVGAALLSGEISTVAMGSTDRVTCTNVLQDRQICTGIVAVRDGSDIVVAITTKFPQAVVVVRLHDDQADVIDRIPVEGYLPTIALSMHAGQLLLAAGDTSGTRVMKIIDRRLTTSVRMSFEPKSLAFTCAGDLLIGLDNGIVAVRLRSL
jgi:hypothetical protein